MLKNNENEIRRKNLDSEKSQNPYKIRVFWTYARFPYYVRRIYDEITFSLMCVNGGVRLQPPLFLFGICVGFLLIVPFLLFSFGSSVRSVHCYFLISFSWWKVGYLTKSHKLGKISSTLIRSNTFCLLPDKTNQRSKALR